MLLERAGITASLGSGAPLLARARRPEGDDLEARLLCGLVFASFPVVDVDRYGFVDRLGVDLSQLEGFDLRPSTRNSRKN